MNILLFTFLSLASADVASEAQSSVTKVCTLTASSYNTSILYTSDLNILESAVNGNNTLITMLTTPGCFSDFSTCYSNNQTGLLSLTASILYPIIIAVIMIILWLFIFMPCACCRCYRRCPFFCCLAEPRYPAGNFTTSGKSVFAVWCFLVLAGFAITAAFAIVASEDITSGVNVAYCQVFQFIAYFINGYTSSTHQWVGLAPMASILLTVVTNLYNQSAFIASVNTGLASTSDLTRAVTSFNTAMTLLSSMVETNGYIPNTHFSSPLGVAGISTSVNAVLSALNTGLAGSLNGFRTTVQSQLSGGQLTVNAANLNAVIEPMTSLSTVIQQSLGTLFITNRDTGLTAMTIIQNIILGVSVCVVVPGLLMLMTVFVGVFKSDRKTFRDTVAFPQNPLHASISWCFTCFYAYIILIVAGILLITIFVFSSTCFIMQNVGTYTGAIINLTGGSSNTSQLQAVVNACLIYNATGDLQDALVANGQTLRQSLAAAGTTATALSKMQTSVSAGVTSNLATSSSLTTLMTAVNNWAGVYVINDMIILKATNGYSSSSSNSAGLYTLLAQMTPECTPASTSPSTSGLTSVAPSAIFPSTLNGVDDFMTLLTADSIQSFSGANPACAGGSQSTAAFDSATSAGGSGDASVFYNWAVLAQNARKYTGFRCDTLNSDGGSSLSTGTGYATMPAYTSTTAAYCVGSTGQTNLGAWLAYLSKFQPGGVYDIIALARAVDVAAAQSQVTLSTNLGSAVATYFTTPLSNLQAQLDCSFISYNFNNIIAALCYGALPGFMGTTISWVSMGLISILVILMEFAIWRRLRDNYSLWWDYRAGLRGTSAVI